MHKVAPDIARHISIPILHIADATGERLRQDGITRVGLLGTRFTMEQAFYKGRLSERFGIDVIVPGQQDRDLVHEVIYQELCLGKITEPSKDSYLRVIGELHANGAQAIILGCTEIALLISQQDTPVPFYDTTAIHAEAAIVLALT